MASDWYLGRCGCAPRRWCGYGCGWGYGYGWEIGTERGRRLYQHFGNIEGFADVVSVYPDEGVVIIILGNQQNKDVAQIHDILSKRVFGDGY